MSKKLSMYRQKKPSVFTKVELQILDKRFSYMICGCGANKSFKRTN